MRNGARTVGSVVASLALLASCSTSVDGSASLADDRGDAAKARNEKGRTPRAVPDGADLVRVALTGEGDRLVVELESATNIPWHFVDGEFLFGPNWYVRIYGQDVQYLLAIAPGGSPDRPMKAGFCASSADDVADHGATGASEISCPFDGSISALRDGPRIVAEIPASELEGIDDGFTWLAASNWNDTHDTRTDWHDHVPELVDETDESAPANRARFPD